MSREIWKLEFRYSFIYIYNELVPDLFVSVSLKGPEIPKSLIAPFDKQEHPF